MFSCSYDSNMGPAGMFSQEKIDITVNAKFLGGLHGGPPSRAITIYGLEYETAAFEGEKIDVLKESWGGNQEVKLT